MNTVAVLGAQALIQGYALAGAVLLDAETADEVRERWAGLPADVVVVVLTRAAAAALNDETAATDAPMTAVMPA